MVIKLSGNGLEWYCEYHLDKFELAPHWYLGLDLQEFRGSTAWLAMACVIEIMGVTLVYQYSFFVILMIGHDLYELIASDQMLLNTYTESSPVTTEDTSCFGASWLSINASADVVQVQRFRVSPHFSASLFLSLFYLSLHLYFIPPPSLFYTPSYSEQRKVCQACYQVIKSYLRGDSRKNENYLARFIKFFQTQVDTHTQPETHRDRHTLMHHSHALIPGPYGT